MSTLPMPSVAVLLATYNGTAYLAEQIRSIAAQKNVRIILFVSDDMSTDGTPPLVETLCEAYHLGYVLLPPAPRMGRAGKNFFRLMRDVPAVGFDYFAFADQDDIWNEDKLIRSIEALGQHADAVSSNVTAFWPDGTKKNVVKNRPQRALDYLFESAGPGCTYVLTARLFRRLQELVRRNESYFLRCELHDWAVYAVARGLGYRWEIMGMSTMLYRQHASNSFGARKGFSALTKRVQMIRDGWMHDQVLAIADLVEHCGSAESRASKYKRLLQHPSLFNKMRLLLSACRFRRRRLDTLMLAAMFLTGIFWPRKVAGKQ